MRFKTLALAAAVATVLTAPVFAELQNVEVGGEIRIRGNHYSAGSFGPTFDDDGEAIEMIEQRSRLNVTADFTDDVTVFIELDNYMNWGSATRQANPFGANALGAAFGIDDVDMYQSYIEMREAWGQPLTLRIGRQEIVLGNEWLVGNNDTAAFFTGLSFDAVTARWDFDGGNIFGWAAKVVEGEFIGFAPTGEADGDSDFYGLYLTYDAIEAVNLEGYWMYLRDASGFGIGNPGSTGDEVGEVHTIGARAYGNVAGFDYDLQAAYQIGETADFGGTDFDISAFAVDATVGYLFENVNNLYIWGGVAYFEGADTFGGDDELSFLRLFSDVEYSEFLADSDMSNVLILRGGASIQATESIEISGVVSWFNEDDEFGDDDEIGIEAAIYASYDYSEDLNFNAGWAHFFADDDIDDGAAIAFSGLGIVGGGDDDVDYFFLETVISF